MVWCNHWCFWCDGWYFNRWIFLKLAIYHWEHSTALYSRLGAGVSVLYGDFVLDQNSLECMVFFSSVVQGHGIGSVSYEHCQQSSGADQDDWRSVAPHRKRAERWSSRSSASKEPSSDALRPTGQYFPTQVVVFLEATEFPLILLFGREDGRQAIR